MNGGNDSHDTSTSSSSSKLPSSSTSPTATCYLDWERRMGIHLAYHQGYFNFVLHSVTIPFLIFGFFLVLQQWKLFTTMMYLTSSMEIIVNFDLGLVFIVLTTPIWILVEPLCGVTFCIVVVCVHYLASILILNNGTWYGFLIFVTSIVLQIHVGHGLLEQNNRDDAHRNIEEFIKTKNPIPLLLIVYYHWIDMFLYFGYKPQLKQRINAYTKERLQWIIQQERTKTK